MKLVGDYHTHTVYSHGKGGILENAESAKKQGLSELGITDHGFSHPAYGVRRRDLLKMKTECYDAAKKTGVNVLLGIEANILNDSGKTDVKPRDYDSLDLYLAGFHKFVLTCPFSYMKLLLPNYFDAALRIKPSKRLIRETTKAYIEVIKKNPIDIIAHANYCVFADVTEVAKACADYGTYMELNSKKTHLTDEELSNLLKTGVQFVVDSDAHCVDRVGDTVKVDEQLKRLDFPTDRIANVDGRLPDFRFKRFKEKGQL